MGGALVMRTAAAVPDRVGAGASFHGGGLVTDRPDSPHLLAPKIKARMYFGVAANDDKQQPEAKDKLKEAFAAAKNPAEVEVYSNAQHGWCMPDMPAQARDADVSKRTRNARGRSCSHYTSPVSPRPSGRCRRFLPTAPTRRSRLPGAAAASYRAPVQEEEMLAIRALAPAVLAGCMDGVAVGAGAVGVRGRQAAEGGRPRHGSRSAGSRCHGRLPSLPAD